MLRVTHLHLLREYLLAVSACKDFELSLIDTLGLAPESPLIAMNAGLQEVWCKQLLRQINPEGNHKENFGWVDWFVYETDFGKKMNTARIGDTSIVIDSIDKLYDHILCAESSKSLR